MAIRRYFGAEIHLFALEDSAGKTLPREKLSGKLEEGKLYYCVLDLVSFRFHLIYFSFIEKIAITSGCII